MSYSKKPKRINPDEVDPSIYCYDEVYDDMKDEEKKESQSKETSSTTKQGAKYIQGLLETAERRNTEKELRKFKKFTKERQEPNDEDVYVTSGYKKKLQEMKALEEETRRRLKDEESSLMNFTKSADHHFEKKSQPLDKSAKETTIEDSSLNKSDFTVTAKTKEYLVEKSKDEENPKNNLEEVEPRKPKQFRTKEERRKYLEHVLAKRTVGKLYDEALARYQKRKSRLQMNLTDS